MGVENRTEIPPFWCLRIHALHSAAHFSTDVLWRNTKVLGIAAVLPMRLPITIMSHLTYDNRIWRAAHTLQNVLALLAVTCLLR